MAAEVLAHSEEALTGQGRPVPSRTYVCHGTPPVDSCDQLTVGWLRIATKLMGRGDPNIRGRFVAPAVTQFAVELWRCWPITENDSDPIPSADTLTAAAEGLATDAWAVWCWLTQLWGERKLFAGQVADLSPGAPPVQWESLNPLGPLGARAGFRLTFTVDVPAVLEAVGA